MGRETYERAVARAVEYIRAGDVFQVNLAHMLCARMRGSPRELFAALGDTAVPWYGALLETPWGVIASASPELFLDFDARTRSVVTRPMKGTRGGEHAPAELLASEKDAAELNMIVDLMRNDLGRVCEFGSVQVQAPREVEAHGAREPAERSERAASGVLQGVATVRGTVRREFGLDELLRAAFPPGSITGAPKVRAMQIIGVLERTRRGPYCGCIGFVSDSGRAEFSVAIRTAVLERNDAESRERGTETGATDVWNVRYGVGAGIVADSDPAAEWRETLVKARIWRGLADIADAT
jgi:anthranilate/para-aminobenzoate synthase component I